jgi:uncharacterized protein YneF (UPF0154 family)
MTDAADALFLALTALAVGLLSGIVIGFNLAQQAMRRQTVRLYRNMRDVAKRTTKR